MRGTCQRMPKMRPLSRRLFFSSCSLIRFRCRRHVCSLHFFKGFAKPYPRGFRPMYFLCACQAVSEAVLAENVREPALPAFKQVSQLLVIQAQQTEHGCMQIMDMDFVFNRAEAKVI